MSLTLRGLDITHGMYINSLNECITFTHCVKLLKLLLFFM